MFYTISHRWLIGIFSLHIKTKQCVLGVHWGTTGCAKSDDDMHMQEQAYIYCDMIHDQILHMIK